MSHTNPYDTPASDLSLPDEEINEIQVLASLGERLGAALIDAIIIGILSTVISLALAGLALDHLPQPAADAFAELVSSPFWSGFVEAITGFLIFVAVQGYFLAENGQTLGKKLLGIKIVTMEGKKPRMEALLLLRSLAPVLLGTIPAAGGYIYLAGILIIFPPRRRCLHDYFAGTKVVQARALPKGNTNPPEVMTRRFPELILASIIRKHLGAEPQSLGESTSWAGDLGRSDAEIRAFHHEIDQLIPSTDPQRAHPSKTYGELLASLGIPIHVMKRVPGKISHPAPVKPGAP